jgi:hypothetical protein
MNFGNSSKAAQLKQQTPTYHVAPNFSIQPPPDGPLDLGTLVEDLRDYYPINQGPENRIPLIKDQIYSDVKSDVIATLKGTQSGEGRILARILDRSIGGDASLKGTRKDEDVYKLARLETVYFYPQPTYIKRCLQLQDVKDYNEMVDYKEPLFLVTGLKIARGATISNEHGRELEGSAGANVTAPAGLLDLQIGASSRLATESGIVSSFGKPADFVVGIQVQKLYHKRKYLVGDRALKVKRVVKNAVLVDDDDAQVDVEDDEEADYVIEGLDDDELVCLAPETVTDATGRDETWLLPRGPI